MGTFTVHTRFLLRDWRGLGQAVERSYTSELEQGLFKLCMDGRLSGMNVEALMHPYEPGTRDTMLARMVEPAREFFERSLRFIDFQHQLTTALQRGASNNKVLADIAKYRIIFTRGMEVLQDCVVYAMITPLIQELDPRHVTAPDSEWWSYEQQLALGYSITDEVFEGFKQVLAEAAKRQALHELAMQPQYRARLMRVRTGQP